MTTPALMLDRIAVIGTGLIGASIAKAAAAVGGSSVRVTDRDAAVRVRARAVGLDVVDSLGACVAGADLVVLAVPAPAVAPVARDVIAAAPAGAVLTDVAGLKGSLVPEVETVLGADAARFVGGHPMAGSERSGPEAADGTLLAGATWILTPTDRTADDSLRRVTAFVGAIGARVLVLEATHHDTLVTRVSHLPQVVASVLADVATSGVDDVDALLAVAGPGFRDSTRIAASDPGPWVELLLAQHDELTTVVDRVADGLRALGDAIRTEDREAVAAVLARASAARRRLSPKPGLGPVTDLVVPLADRPGALAEVTRVLGEAGINVEDLSLRHASHGARGALVVRVRAEIAARARDTLAAADLAVATDGPAREGSSTSATAGP